MSFGAIVPYLWSFVDFYSVLVLLVAYWSTKYLMWHGFLLSRKKLPPGFFGFPFVTALPYFVFSNRSSFETLESLSKQFGPVLRFRIGHDTILIVTGTEAVREAMLSDDLLGRPKSPIDDGEVDFLFGKKSLLSIEGDLWKKHRRFSLTALRDLGFGKTPVMEQRIQAELRSLIERIEKENGQPFDIQPALVESTGNNISSLVSGGRFGTDEDLKKKVSRTTNAIFKENEKLVNFVFLPFIFKIMMKLEIGVVKRIKTYVRNFTKIMRDDIESHRIDLDKDHPGDYVDHYLIAQEKDEDFTNELAEGNTMALFFAGSSTVRTTVEYLLHLMAKFPEVQRKVQAEIDEVTGRSREVIWADSQQLVYTMAVIAERHRYFTVAPAGVNRRVMRPTKLCGYDLEMNDQIFFSIDSVHFDPATFQDPYEFRPERFIDSNGKLVDTEKVWAFSLGKRACPGETLAVLEVFLYFALILQNFVIEKDKPVQLRRLRCLIAETIPQKLRFVRRS